MSKNRPTLRVPCSLISVDSPKRREFLEAGLPQQLHENILGHGSYGTVVKAIYKDQQVAVKIIDNFNPGKRGSIANEANILGWEHQNIIKILKIDSGLRQAVIIMERFPGQCLQHILESIKIPLFHIINISTDIANGLSYCHERNLLHLDVKPKNILVAVLSKSGDNNPNYQCKLCDFGSSMLANNGNKDSAVRGTIRYMAPELLKSEMPSTKADMYSFGITMWQLMSGKDPFYWILDNETVAYKVVKENLRPDNKLSSQCKIYLSPRVANNCLCKHYGSDQPDSLIESTSPLRLTASPAKQTSNSSRTPFSNLNKNANSLISPKKKTSSLSQSYFLQANTPAMKIKSNAGNENLDILGIFQRKPTPHKEHITSAYQKLYKKCWDVDPFVRPNCSAVCISLKDILNDFKQY